MPEVDIRSLVAADQASLVCLWKDVFADDPPWNEPSEMIKRKLTVQPELLLVAVVGSKLVGAVMGGFDGVRGWIHHLAVHPEYRRQGIARLLIQAAESGLVKLGCPKVNLQVRATNTSVIAFYQALGYDLEERASLGKRLATRKAAAATSGDAMNTVDFAANELSTTREFAAEIGAAAQKSVGEFFSPESNPVRLTLIGTSLLALLLKYGAISVGKIEVSTPMNKFELQAGPQFTLALAAVLVFLLVLYLQRYFIDRYTWVSGKEVGDLAVMALDLKLRSWEAAHIAKSADPTDSEIERDLRAAHLKTRHELCLARTKHAKLAMNLRKYLEIPFPVLLGLAAVYALIR
jgi:ribosomal protein S18 acetylase RimI-like enzyme